MPPGVRIREIATGTGAEAVRGKVVVVDVRLYLNRGEEITSMMGGTRLRIDLGQRECIAGLRYGIEGMRVGGKRDLTISPHLAYGADGVPGRIPPDAVIRAVVELIDVGEPAATMLEGHPPGRHLVAFRPGEESRHLPRWEFGLQEDGRCWVLITYPIPGMPWRRNPMSHTEGKLDADTTKACFDEVIALPAEYPQDGLRHGDLWADHSEKANAITRDSTTDTLCLTIGVQQGGQWLACYSLRETSRAVAESPLIRRIEAMVSTAKPTTGTRGVGPHRCI